MANLVAVIGSEEVVVPFRALGVDVFPLTNIGGARAKVEALVSQGYQLIFFTDELARELQPLIERFRATARPCLVALPFTAAESGADRVRDAVRRACGVDILSAQKI